MKTILVISLMICLLFPPVYPAYSQGLIGTPIKITRNRNEPKILYPYPENTERLLFSVPKNSDVNGMIDISFSISADGTMHALRLKESSGVDEFDFDCLAALLGSLPYPKSLPVSQTDDIHFGLASGDCGTTKNDLLRIKNQKARQQFRRTKVLSADRFFVLNTIPVDAYFRYPGVLTINELINQKTLSPFQSHGSIVVMNPLSTKFHLTNNFANILNGGQTFLLRTQLRQKMNWRNLVKNCRQIIRACLFGCLFFKRHNLTVCS